MSTTTTPPPITVANETTGASAPPRPQPPEAEAAQRVYNFPVSDVPANPLGEGRHIKTAAALIIGCVYFSPASTVSW